ncbi:hypothetical protein DPMN_144910 [Dreissena polymorpha]|uniref:Uncharacterized protein n=1 Tax=Dreissena polymorpha TaxID=45954 RepID=A0A9D4F2Y6_DREPO|nr:hypothetical protein DPMN_144910 [Dreissena polymorpha]
MFINLVNAELILAGVCIDGSAGDAQVFNTSELTETIDMGVLGLLDNGPLLNDNKPNPF